MPFARLELEQVHQSAARALPAHLAREWNVVAFRLEPGRLHVAGAGPPSDEHERALRAATDLEIRYYLVTPANLAALTQQSR